MLNKGFGTQLYTRLLANMKNLQFHIVLGGIALPNNRSQRLHEILRFTKVAHFSEVGNKFNQWIDVGYWQLKLN